MASRSSLSAADRPTRARSASCTSSAGMKKIKRADSTGGLSNLSKKRKESQPPVASQSTPGAELTLSTPEPRRPTADLNCYEVLDGDFRALVRVRCLDSQKSKEVSPDNASDATLPGQSAWWKDMETSKLEHSPSKGATGSRMDLFPDSLSVYGARERFESKGTLLSHPADLRSDSTDGNLVVPRNEIEAGSYPSDWSLKLTSKFVSKQPFDWVDFTSEEKANHTRSFIASTTEAQSTEQIFSNGLMQWRHPATPHPPAMDPFFLKVNDPPQQAARNNQNMEWVRHRVQEWNDAFYSLYYMMKTGACGYFYYQGASFYVLFKGASEGAPPSAFLSSSTKTLRKRLSDEGVAFTMPIVTPMEGGMSADDRARYHAELRELGNEDDVAVRHTSGLNFNDGGPNTILFIQGKAVHALFDFLLNQNHDRGLPTLISPVAFEKSALKPARCSYKRVKQGNARCAADEEQYLLEVEEPLLPSGLQLVMQAVCQKQEAFHVTFKTDPKTLAFNGADPRREVGGEGSRRAVVCKARWTEGRMLLSTNTLG